jgi:hypothetical protein
MLAVVGQTPARKSDVCSPTKVFRKARTDEPVLRVSAPY